MKMLARSVPRSLSELRDLKAARAGFRRTAHRSNLRLADAQARDAEASSCQSFKPT
jgi:hypothetical protein